MIVSEGALVADANKSGRSYVRVANRAFAVALVAESSKGDSCLFAAHNEIGMMAGHDCERIALEMVR